MAGPDQIFEHFFHLADVDRDGRISGGEAVAFFQRSGLPQLTLAKVWQYADQSQAGFLSRPEFFAALRLVTVAQSGRDLTPDIARLVVGGGAPQIPPPRIAGVPGLPQAGPGGSGFSAPQGPGGSGFSAPQAPAGSGFGAPQVPNGSGFGAPQAPGGSGFGDAQGQSGFGAPQGGFGAQAPAAQGFGPPGQRPPAPAQGFGGPPAQGFTANFGPAGPTQPRPPQAGTPSFNAFGSSAPAKGPPSVSSTGSLSDAGSVDQFHRPASSGGFTNNDFSTAKSAPAQSFDAFGPGKATGFGGPDSFAAAPKGNDAQPKPAGSSSFDAIGAGGNPAASATFDAFGGGQKPASVSSASSATFDAFNSGPKAATFDAFGAKPTESDANKPPAFGSEPFKTSFGGEDAFSARPPSSGGSAFGGDTFSPVQKSAGPSPSASRRVSGFGQDDAFQAEAGSLALAPYQKPAESSQQRPGTAGGTWPRMTTMDAQRYTQVFASVDTDRDGKISGTQARDLFLSWGMPREILKQIWDLADQDLDSMLSHREFCTALYFMERYREGRQLPPSVSTGIHIDDPAPDNRAQIAAQQIAAAQAAAAQSAVAPWAAGGPTPGQTQPPPQSTPFSSPQPSAPQPAGVSGAGPLPTNLFSAPSGGFGGPQPGVAFTSPQPGGGFTGPQPGGGFAGPQPGGPFQAGGGMPGPQAAGAFQPGAAFAGPQGGAFPGPQAGGFAGGPQQGAFAGAVPFGAGGFRGPGVPPPQQQPQGEQGGEAPKGQYVSRVPNVDLSKLGQLRRDEQDTIQNKLSDVQDMDKKVWTLDNDLMDAKQKTEFYREKLQELVLFETRCKNRLAEIGDRAATDKREAEALAKRYDDKYKATQGVSNRLAQEEAAFADVVARKHELAMAVQNLEQGGDPNAHLQEKVDKLVAEIDAIHTVLAERAPKLGVKVKAPAPAAPASQSEAPFGWQETAPLTAADFDPDWDKFEDEGFVTVEGLASDTPPAPRPVTQSWGGVSQATSQGDPFEMASPASTTGKDLGSPQLPELGIDQSPSGSSGAIAGSGVKGSKSSSAVDLFGAGSPTSRFSSVPDLKKSKGPRASQRYAGVAESQDFGGPSPDAFMGPPSFSSTNSLEGGPRAFDSQDFGGEFSSKTNGAKASGVRASGAAPNWAPQFQEEDGDVRASWGIHSTGQQSSFDAGGQTSSAARSPLGGAVTPTLSTGFNADFEDKPFNVGGPAKTEKPDPFASFGLSKDVVDPPSRAMPAFKPAGFGNILAGTGASTDKKPKSPGFGSFDDADPFSAIVPAGNKGPDASKRSSAAESSWSAF